MKRMLLGFTPLIVLVASFLYLFTLVPKAVAAEEDDYVIANFDSDTDGFDRAESVNGLLKLQNPNNGDASTKKIINDRILSGYNSIEFDIDLNGNVLLGGDAGAIFIDQGGQKMVPLKNKLQNGSTGLQHLKIGLSEFPRLNTNDGIASIYFRFWNYTEGFYNIDNIVLTKDNTIPSDPTDPTDPTEPNDPTEPTSQSNYTLAKFENNSGGFDEGIVANGALKLQNPENGDASTKKMINDKILNGYNAIEFDLNLNGNTLLNGDAGAVFFDQGGQKMVALANKVEQGKNDWQHLKVALSEFPGLDTSDGIASIYFRFWNYQTGTYELDNIIFTKDSTNPTDPTDPTDPSDPEDPRPKDPNPILNTIVPNPSFEETTIDSSKPLGWEIDGWGTNTAVYEYLSTGHTGNRSIKATVTSYTNGDAKWYFAHQSVEAGKTYLFSDWYQSNVPTQVTIEIVKNDGTFDLKWTPLSRQLNANS